MRIKLAGGCGEHGRNCFYIEGSSLVFLVDCGLMAGEKEGGFPHLTKSEIQKLQSVFLTHSHADHSGALPWLIEQGFAGNVIASRETLAQLPFSLPKQQTIEEFQEEHSSFLLSYGRTGHCIGSVWYQFKLDETTLFFSGDYVEENYVHKIDWIRNKKADLAIIDCAYGRDDKSLEDYTSALLDCILEKKETYQILLLPVPKYGRGLEIYWLLQQHFPHWSYCGDSHFVQQLTAAKQSDWIKNDISFSDNIVLYEENIKADIVFVSDPQLRSDASRAIASRVLTTGHAIMTGTVEKGSQSEKLLQQQQMTMLRFPIHLNFSQFHKVASLNSFDQIIAYHSTEFDHKKEILL